MKRLVLALCLGVMTCNVAVAKPVKIVTPETVKLEIANWNTWLMCTLPEVWYAEDPDKVLEASGASDDPEKRWIFAVYVRTYYRIMDDYFGDEPELEQILTGNLGALSNYYDDIVSHLSEKEKKATLVKNCNEDWGKVRLKRRKQLGYTD